MYICVYIYINLGLTLTHSSGGRCGHARGRARPRDYPHVAQLEPRGGDQVEEVVVGGKVGGGVGIELRKDLYVKR